MPKGMGRIANVIGDCGSCEAAEQTAFIVIKKPGESFRGACALPDAQASQCPQPSESFRAATPLQDAQASKTTSALQFKPDRGYDMIMRKQNEMEETSMAIENGEWYMKGLSWDNPMRIRTWEELVNWVDEVGFLPLFANEIEGFSAEEHVSPDFWWTGIEDQDPWAWREIIARSCRAAYGKFFAGKAGFISLRWLPFFANYRREGYDFDSRWEDGKASRREKNIMDLLTDRDGDGDVIWTRKELLSTEIKKKAGFGKGGEKNFPGMMTGLQMQTYLVITDFRRRRNKKGDEYGMAVSIPNTPEAVWGYDLVSSAYTEAPEESWRRICSRVKEVFPGAAEGDIIRLIGKKP